MAKQDDVRRRYNENLTTLAQKYASLKPLGSYILRMFIKDDIKTKSGIIIPVEKVHGTSHSGFKNVEASDPYRFTSKAVVVCIPEGEPELTPGDIVQVVRPMPILVQESVVGYENQYAHPDYTLPMVPVNPEDEDFGYVIMPRHLIKVIIEKFKQ